MKISEYFDSSWLKMEPHELDGNCLWLKKNEGQVTLYISPTIKAIGDQFVIRVIAACTHSEFGEFCKKILKETGNLLPTMESKSFSTKLFYKAEIYKELEKLIEEIEIWSNSIDFNKKMRWFHDSRPNIPQMYQVWHIAALSYYENYEQLMQYQDLFLKGNKLNFLPIVTKEMLDLAVEYAVRNL